MIAARGLVKTFGRAPALRGIDLDLSYGESLALLGPNGAGKTTLLRLLATLDRPTAGSLAIGGLDALKDRRQVRTMLGVVAHQTYLHAELSTEEDLRFYGRLYGLPQLDDRISAVLGQVGLEAQSKRRVASLSRGQQQRLAIARALLHDPPLLLLDEPDTGLDDQGLAMLSGVLSGGGRSVVFSSHNRDWAASLSRRRLVLDAGRVVDRT